MATQVNTASPASGGITIGRDPDYGASMPDEQMFKGGTADTLDGRPSMDVLAKPRTRKFKLMGLTNTQWTSLKPYLISANTTYWRFPHEAADTKWLIEKSFRATPRKLPGDTITAPHWDVEDITLDEVL